MRLKSVYITAFSTRPCSQSMANTYHTDAWQSNMLLDGASHTPYPLYAITTPYTTRPLQTVPQPGGGCAGVPTYPPSIFIP